MEETAMQNEIGTNAGKIYDAIEAKGPQTLDNIAKVTELKSTDVDKGIGWLARESKLNFGKDKQGRLEVSLRQ